MKSGKDYERHSALDNVMKVDDYEIDEAFVFTCGNVKKDGRVVYLPVYMVMFLSDNPQWTVDISAGRYVL